MVDCLTYIIFNDLPKEKEQEIKEWDNKQDIQMAFVNALKAMDEIKTQEEANKEKVKEVFDIIAEKIKEYDIAELDKIQTD